MTWEDLKDEPTEHLIEYIKCRVDPGYEELAKAAYVALNFRFRADVEDKTWKIGRHRGLDREACDQLAEKAFVRLYKYPYKITRSKFKTPSFDEGLKLYLYQIVENCLNDHHKEILNAEISPYDGTEEVVIEFPELDALVNGVNDDLREIHHKMETALNSLTLNHRIIFLTYKAHEKDGFKLPRALLKKLREVTGLSQSSIRVYKKEITEVMEQIQHQNGEQKAS